MFERFSDSLMQALQVAFDECSRMKSETVTSGHLLVGLMDEGAEISARALAALGIERAQLVKEVEKSVGFDEISARQRVTKEFSVRPVPEEPDFGEDAAQAIRLAEDQRRYFGAQEVLPEHLLLAIIDIADAGAVRILDDMGANLPFLRRHVMYLMAEAACFFQTAPSLKSALVAGLKELFELTQEAADTLELVARRSGSTVRPLPDHTEIVHMVCVGYLPEFLAVQVVFQRYLLEESLKVLAQRTGVLDQETSASLVSTAAQNLRAEVRSTIEYLWSSEYRLFDQMLDDAEYDLIGSVIEDLWWAQSEELALHELFDSALVDHRRKQALSLQKRRIEISQRITKLRGRLTETIRQCLVRRSIPA